MNQTPTTSLYETVWRGPGTEPCELLAIVWYPRLRRYQVLHEDLRSELFEVLAEAAEYTEIYLRGTEPEDTMQLRILEMRAHL